MTKNFTTCFRVLGLELASTVNWRKSHLYSFFLSISASDGHVWTLRLDDPSKLLWN